MSEWISCEDNEAPNLIGETVLVRTKGHGLVEGQVIDRDETGFSVKYFGIIWNVRQVKRENI